MFHLFNQSYLEYAFLFDGQHPHFLASDRWYREYMVDSEYNSGINNKFPEYQDLLRNKFDNNVELLWHHMLEPEKRHKRFVLYVDHDVLTSLQLQYWKSVLDGPSFETCYFLHKVFVQDKKIKNSFMAGRNPERAEHIKHELCVMERETYQKLYDATQVSEALSRVPIENLSYEYLLATYLSEPEGHGRAAFLKTLETHAWQAFVTELEILKGDIAKGIYDYTQAILRNRFEKFDFEQNLEVFEHLVRNERDLLWIVDDKITSQNGDYIRQNYPLELFIRLQREQYSHHMNKEQDSELFNDDIIIKIFEYVYNQQYEELLKWDIATGFGSFLFNNFSNADVNEILISYFYDLYRQDKRERLREFRVRATANDF